MKVSIDGLRKNLTNATKDLMNQLAEVIEEHQFYDSQFENITKTMDEVRGYVSFLNCIHDDTNKKDFNEIELKLPFMEDLIQNN